MWGGEPMEIPVNLKKVPDEDTPRGGQAYFLSF
jgi:hypothetical protein